MIRVNLIREYEAPKRSWTPSTSKVEQVGLAIFAAGALVMGGWYWALVGQRTGIKEEMGQLQQRNVELKVIRAQVQQFKKQRLQLEERIQTIENLRARKQGPVQLMNEVMVAMPEEPRLWLTNLEQRDTHMLVVGRAFDVLALADFIAELSDQETFASVDLERWQEVGDIVNFTLQCRLALQPEKEG